MEYSKEDLMEAKKQIWGVGVGPVGIGQHLQGYLEGEKLLDFYVR